MVHYNYGRIKITIANLKESINDIDKALSIYDKMKNDSEMESIIGNSIRMSFVQIREAIYSGVSSLIKSSGLSVNSFNSNMEIIMQCKKDGHFKNINDEFFIILNKYRNSACHRYKQPTVKDISEFYRKNRGNINAVIEDLEKIINKQ